MSATDTQATTTTTPPTTTTTTTTTAPTTTTTTAVSASEMIVLFDFDFAPASPTVVQGTVITFDNTEGFHDLNWVSAPYPNRLPAEGSPWDVTFTADTAGAFAFWCSIHGTSDRTGMAGTLTVNAP